MAVLNSAHIEKVHPVKSPTGRAASAPRTTSGGPVHNHATSSPKTLDTGSPSHKAGARVRAGPVDGGPGTAWVCPAPPTDAHALSPVLSPTPSNHSTGHGVSLSFLRRNGIVVKSADTFDFCTWSCVLSPLLLSA